MKTILSRIRVWIKTIGKKSIHDASGNSTPEASREPAVIKPKAPPESINNEVSPSRVESTVVEATSLPEDIINEINATACSETDRVELTKLVTGMNAQMARVHVALSNGSMATLKATFEANPWLYSDYRDLIIYAMDEVDYYSNYFIDPFSDEMKQNKKRKQS